MKKSILKSYALCILLCLFIPVLSKAQYVTFQEKVPCAAGEGNAYRVALSANGDRVVVVARIDLLDSELRLFELKEDACPKISNVRLRGKMGAVIFSPDDALVVHSLTMANILIRDSTTLVEIRKLSDPNLFGVRALSFGKDERIITAVGMNGFISRWDVTTGELLSRFELGKKVDKATFSNEGERLLVERLEDHNRIFSLWDVKAERLLAEKTLQEDKRLNSPEDLSASLSFSADGRRIVTRDRAGLVRIFDGAMGLLNTRKLPVAGKGCLAFLPRDQNLLVFTQREDELNMAVLNSENDIGVPLQREQLANAPITRELGISSDGMAIVVMQPDGAIEVFKRDRDQ